MQQQQQQQQSQQDIVLQGHDIRDNIKKIRSRGIKINTNQSQQPNTTNNNKSIKKCNTCKLFCFITLFILFITGITLTALHNSPLSNSLTISSSQQQDNINRITGLVLVINRNQDQTLKSINSLIKNSGINFYQIFVICNYKYSIQMLDDINVNINWVFSNKYLNMQIFDQLLSYVQTEYYYFMTTQWQLLDNTFIQYSFKQLQKNKNVVQVIAQEKVDNFTIIGQNRPIGFTYRPGLHRIEDYQLAKGGYSAITGPECLLTPSCQKAISDFYFTKGFHALGCNTFKINKLNMGDVSQSYLIKQKQKQLEQKQLQQRYKYRKPKSQKQKSMIQQTNQQQQLQYQSQSESQTQTQPIQEQKTQIQLIAQKKTQQQNPFVQFSKNSNKVTAHPSQPSSHLSYLQYLLKPANKIYQIQKLTSLKQLPFCLIILPTDKANLQTILQSIQIQNYTLYKIINFAQQQKTPNYYTVNNKLKKQCPNNQYIMFLNSPLQLNALYYLNSYHQKYKAWITYSRTDHTLQLHSFLYRVYELIQLNDFRRIMQQSLKQNNIQYQMLAMLEMCKQSVIQVYKPKILKNVSKYSYLTIAQSTVNHKYGYQQYRQIYRLSQDMPINDIGAYFTFTTNPQGKKASPLANLNYNDLLQAVQRQQLIYLPQNHSIAQLQYLQFVQKFKINKYQNIENQLPFCITVLNHNNMQHGRYIKAIKSILQQKYHNYHIVYIDDKSTDGNLQAIMKYFNEIGFDKQRITYIQNLQRNYATYNILNAAFNYCKQDQIQILIDGDDQFIGRYVFSVFNAVYQQNKISNNDLWLVYSNYKTSQYGYGRSIPFFTQSGHMVDGKRIFISNIGPVRSWRVQLLYNIPIEHHKMIDGRWLDTVYDDALQHPLMQLSTVKRVKYLNQIFYQYNVKYGDNDDSTLEKIKHRTSTYNQLLKLTPLNPLESLDRSVKNRDVVNALNQDQGIKYKKLQF